MKPGIRVFRPSTIFWIAPCVIGLCGCQKGQPSAFQPLQMSQSTLATVVGATMTPMPGIRPDLFDRPLRPGEGVAVKPTPIVSKANCAVLGPEPDTEDPLKDIIFKGYATIDGEQLALLENAKSGVGEYVKVSDDFHGVKITGIDNSSVKYASATGERQLAMNTKYSLVPLSRGGSDPGDVPAQTVESEPVLINSLSYSLPTGLTTMGRIYTGITDEQARDLQSKVFDGKMTQDEANDQGLQQHTNGTLILRMRNDLVLDDMSVVSGREEQIVGGSR